MFRKKNKAPPAPPNPGNQNQNATPSAVTAAAQVFLKKQASDANLSSAAAAAALRSHTTSPTSPATIQTKRMVRRNSNSSIGSGTGSLRQPFSSGLQRNGSNGSMTERTFRSPSPAAVPPVPALPSNVPPLPTKSHKRAMSHEAPVPRVTSPTPQNGARAVSVDRGATVAAKRAVPPPTLPRVSELAERQDLVRPSSPRGGIKNFSRPMSPSQQSPTTSPTTATNTNRPKTLPSGDAARMQRELRKASEQPVSKNTSKMTKPAEGSHLATAVSPTSPASSTKPPVSSVRPASAASAKAQQARPISPSQRPMTPTEKSALAAQRKAAAMLARPRSAEPPLDLPVREHETIPPVPKVQPAAKQAPPLTVTTPQPRTRAVSHPVEPNAQLQTPTAQVQRTSSVSPSRSAHFSEKPVLEVIKHDPPPRSLSPAKSALKGSTPRPGSPADSRTGGSEINDDPAQTSDDGTGLSVKKKKSARVSFDEQATPIGQAATPTSPYVTIMSPQYKRSPPGAFNTDSEDEETMAPMPALPSFGSVRGRKDTEPDPVSDPATVPAASPSDAASLEHQTTTQTPVTPVIAILPATPGLDEQEKELTSTSAVDETPKDLEEVLSAAEVKHVAQSSPKDVSPPVFTNAQAEEHQSHIPDAASSDYGSEDEVVGVADDDAEVYTDAEEHTSDQEPAFASLDAILESPSSEMPQSTFPTSQQDEADVAPGSAVTTNETIPEEDGDWNHVKAYWSSLSRQQQRDMELKAIPVDDTVGSSGSAPMVVDVWADDQNADAARGLNSQPALTTLPDQQYQQSLQSTAVPSGNVVEPSTIASDSPDIQPPPKTKTMTASVPTIEKPGTGSSPVSMPIVQGTPPSKTTARGAAVGAIAAGSQGRPNETKKLQKPALRRLASDDSSASDSSFKKMRPKSSALDEGRYSMRRSMRGGPEPAPAASARPTSPSSPTMRTSLRGPPAAPAATSGRYTMRGSARSSIDSTPSTLRTDQRAPKESSGIFGLGKGNKKKSKAASKPSSKPATRFSSRFADSSDEEDDRPVFRSRFADSDDSDDEYAPPPPSTRLAPVRGIPRRAGQDEGDSTDLDDSDDEVTPSTNPTTVSDGTPQKGTAVADGTTLAALTANDPNSQNNTNLPDGITQDKRRSGFLGFGKKKHPEDSAVRPGTADQQGVTSRPSSRMSKTMRDSPSAGRPGFWRRLSGSHSTLPAAASRQEDHPFPPPPIPDQYKQSYSADRPNTSDGTSQSAVRPPLGSKRDSNMTAPPGEVKAPIVSERTGKKKRFQGLRRFVGLHD